jgi:hypothetical protein
MTVEYEDDFDDDDEVDDAPPSQVLLLPAREHEELRQLDAKLKKLHERQRDIAVRSREYRRLRSEGIDEDEAWMIADVVLHERRGSFSEGIEHAWNRYQQGRVVSAAQRIYTRLKREQGIRLERADELRSNRSCLTPARDFPSSD